MMTTDSEDHDKWKDTIKKLFDEGKLRSHQCIVYNKDSQSTATYEKCGCQRYVRHHSFEGPALTTKPQLDQWKVNNHTRPLTSLIYHSTSSTKVREKRTIFFFFNMLNINLVFAMFM